MSMGVASVVGVVAGFSVTVIPGGCVPFDASLSSVLILLLVDVRGNVKSATSLSNVLNLSLVDLNAAVRVR